MQIELQGVHYSYPAGVHALNGVSLSVAAGERVALIGKNGSGKTTLARHLNGLLRPGRGEVTIGDWSTYSRSPAKLAQRVAYVFQNPDEQLFCQRIWDEVAFGPKNLGYEPPRIRTLVEQSLKWVGLEAQVDLNPRDLGYSGRKQVALAAALAMDTPILIFDEPTAGLDAGELEMLAQVLRSLAKEKTVWIISHDMDFVAENLGRIILLEQGKVILDAPTEEFFNHENELAEAGIQLPQVVRLSRGMGQSNVALNVDQFLRNCIKL